MQFNAPGFAHDLASVFPEAITVAAVVTLVFAVLVYVYPFLWVQISWNGPLRVLAPIRNAFPVMTWWLILFPPLTGWRGVQRLTGSLQSMYLERFRTRTTSDVEDLKSVPSGSRVRASGPVKIKKAVTAPFSPDVNTAMVYWGLDEWTGTRWKEHISELRSGTFELVGIDRFNESVYVDPDEHAEYSLEGVTPTTTVFDEQDPIPDGYREVLQEHAPFADNRLRFREVRIQDEDHLSVFGEMNEKSVNGTWKRAVMHPSGGDVRLLLTTENVPRLHQGVWRDTSANLITGLLLVAYGLIGTAAFSEILIQVVLSQ